MSDFKYYVHLTFENDTEAFEPMPDEEAVIDYILQNMPCHYTIIYGRTKQLGIIDDGEQNDKS